MSLRLKDLAAAIGASFLGDAEITGIAIDSRKVRKGDLFIALPGTHQDGEKFISDARARGAAGIVAASRVTGLPTIQVDDVRGALPHLAAAYFGHPAQSLRLLGITGSLGKTSTACFLHRALDASGIGAGLIGSLGVFAGRRHIDTGMTSPEADTLHRALRMIADEGFGTAIMEVTSHALLMGRTDGLSLALGVITNIVPDEHLEFHPTPEHYIETKLRFLSLLAPGAPLIVNADDPIAFARTRGLARPVIDFRDGDDAEADVCVGELRLEAHESRLVLRVPRMLPALCGALAPLELPLRMPLLGKDQALDVALAASAALLAGAHPEAIAAAAQTVRPLKRRMEVVHADAPLILDDTTGNPRSLEGVFDFVGRLCRRGRLRVVFGLRGMRGVSINERLAATLAHFVRREGADLIVTASEDVADSRNRVGEDERRSALAALTRAGAVFRFEPDLRTAIRRICARLSAADVVLLLGAQGMDQAAELVRERLRSGAGRSATA
jgi:UDP-N-acetylmuramyl-tripeptide synthetase